MGVAAYSLFSSSSGNCEFITDGETSFLIDAGCSAKRITEALCALGASPENVSAVFVTHEHSDHIAALRVLTQKYGFAVHAPAVCAPYIPVPIGEHEREFSVRLGAFTVNSFATSHDSRCSVGYVITHDGGDRFAVATDTGCVTEQMKDALCGCRAVLLESNYDGDMLKYGPYPEDLKRRIASDCGHLSNAQCAGFLPYLYGKGTRRVVLGHISPENNTPQTALSAALACAAEHGLSDMQIVCAERYGITRII